MTDAPQALVFELKAALVRLRQLKFSARDQTRLSDGDRYLLWQIGSLRQGKPVRPTELATELGVTLSAVTHHLKSLEAAGLIIRKSAKGDRRVVTVTLTARIRAQRKLLYRQFFGTLQALVDHLGEAKTRQLLTLLSEIGDFMHQRRGQAS